MKLSRLEGTQDSRLICDTCPQRQLFSLDSRGTITKYIEKTLVTSAKNHERQSPHHHTEVILYEMPKVRDSGWSIEDDLNHLLLGS